jgi:hypothetical protein
MSSRSCTIDIAIGKLAFNAAYEQTTAADALLYAQAIEQLVRAQNIQASTEVVKQYGQTTVQDPLAGFDMSGSAN